MTGGIQQIPNVLYRTTESNIYLDKNEPERRSLMSAYDMHLPVTNWLLLWLCLF